MKKYGLLFSLLLSVLYPLHCLWADRYVWADNPAPAPPYDSWVNAATDIQTAVDAASAGETVWVTNGLYQSAVNPMIEIDKSLNLRAVVTNTAVIIDGENARRAIRVTLTTPSQVLIEGLTVSNCVA